MASVRKGVYVTVDPTINQENIYMNHGFGLENVNKPVSQTLVDNIHFWTLGGIKAWLGINDTENDRAWDRIRNRGWLQM